MTPSKVIRPENPYFKNSHQKQSRWKIRWGVLVFWMIVISVGVYFFRYSSFFNISHVIAEGGKNIKNDEVKLIAEKYLENEKNLFKFPVDEVEKEIKNTYLQVNKVNVTRGVPKTIKIEIIERDGFLVWRSNDQNYLVDSKGVVFKETKDTFSLPVVIDNKNKDINLGDKIITKSFVSFLQKINKNFTKQTKLKIKEIIIEETPFEIFVKVSKGWEVKFDTTRDANKQIEALVKVLPHIEKKIKKYVDLRTENWVYYR